MYGLSLTLMSTSFLCVLKLYCFLHALSMMRLYMVSQTCPSSLVIMSASCAATPTHFWSLNFSSLPARRRLQGGLSTSGTRLSSTSCVCNKRDTTPNGNTFTWSLRKRNMLVAHTATEKPMSSDC